MTKMHARKHTHTHSKDPYDTQPDDVLQTSLQYKVQVRAMRHENVSNLRIYQKEYSMQKEQN